MRSIVLSNSVLVVTPIPDDHRSNFIDDAVVIRDQLNEIIELVPIVPKLHKLSTIIRDRQYDEGKEDENSQEHGNKVIDYFSWLENADPLFDIVDAVHVPGGVESNTSQRNGTRKEG